MTRIGKSRPIVALNLYADPELKGRIQEIAAEEGKPRGRYIEEVLWAHIANREEGHGSHQATRKAK